MKPLWSLQMKSDKPKPMPKRCWICEKVRLKKEREKQRRAKALSATPGLKYGDNGLNT